VPGTPSYEELAAENAELKRVVAELSDRICALERRLSADSSNLLAATIVGCTVGQEAGEEAFVADRVGTQAWQAAGRALGLAEPGG